MHPCNTYTLGIHSLTVLSLDAEATRWPDGEKATDNIASCIKYTQCRYICTCTNVHVHTYIIFVCMGVLHIERRFPIQ